MVSHIQAIEWEHIDYFNNAVICQLIEHVSINYRNAVLWDFYSFAFHACLQPSEGILAHLDDECLRPGQVSLDRHILRYRLPYLSMHSLIMPPVYLILPFICLCTLQCIILSPLLRLEII